MSALGYMGKSQSEINAKALEWLRRLLGESRVGDLGLALETVRRESMQRSHSAASFSAYCSAAEHEKVAKTAESYLRMLRINPERACLDLGWPRKPPGVKR